MKRNKGIAIGAACILLLTFALGMSGKVTLARKDTGDNTEGDRLIGVLVTVEPLDLFDMDAYLNDNIDSMLLGGEISMADTVAYQGRLYAALVERTYINEETGETEKSSEYAFEGVHGFSYFSAQVADEAGSYHAMSGDDAFADGHINLNVTDFGSSIALTGTIYIAPTGGDIQYYFNPVRQTPDGRVYAVSGSGFFIGSPMSEGEAFSQKLSEKWTETLDGATKTLENTVEIKISVMYPPKSIAIVQMDAQNHVLQEDVFAPDQVPNSLTPLSETAYIVIVTDRTDEEGNTLEARTLVSRGDETLQTFFSRDDGVCVKRDTQLNW